MIKYFNRYAASLMVLLTLLVPVAVPTSAFAACSKTAEGINKGVQLATGSSTDNCTSTNVSSTDVGHIARNIVNIFSIIVGAVSILMIIYGGFRYITSGGDSGRVGNAKNTLIYALVGLVIVALAQLIVHFVLNQTGSLGS